jgi:hypothetical protein
VLKPNAERYLEIDLKEWESTNSFRPISRLDDRQPTAAAPFACHLTIVNVLG